MIYCQSTAPASNERLYFCQHDSVQNHCRIDIKEELHVGSAKISLSIENQKYSLIQTP